MQPLESHLARQIEKSSDFFWHRVRWALVSRFFPSKPGFELVDIGAGAGLAGRYLKRDFPTARYFFVEPIASLSDRLASEFGSESRLSEDSSYTFADVVLLLDVIEHQKDDHAFARQIIERMSLGAELIVTVPALPMLWSTWDEKLGHFRRYTMKTLTALFAGLPVEIERSSYFLPELVPLGLLRKWRRSEGSEFPDLPAGVNNFFTRLFGFTSVFWPFIPAGTSLLIVLRKKAPHG